MPSLGDNSSDAAVRAEVSAVADNGPRDTPHRCLGELLPDVVGVFGCELCIVPTNRPTTGVEVVKTWSARARVLRGDENERSSTSGLSQNGRTLADR